MTHFALMLFAAGKGTRMQPLTHHLPKPLIPVAGRPLIDHALNLARQAHSAPIVVNTHYRADQIVAHLAGQDIRLSHEPILLETGGGLRAALPLLGPGPVILLNSDAVWTGPNPLIALAQAWEPGRMDGLLMTLPAAETPDFHIPGDFLTNADGRLTRANGRAGDAYLGAQILKPEDLHEISEDIFSLNKVWDRMISRGRLFGLRHQGRWCDVGRPASIALAEDVLRGSA